MEMCKHGIPAAFCATCMAAKNEEGIRRPRGRKTATVHGASAVKPEQMSELGFVAIRALRKHHSHSHLNSETRAVHINGLPFLWLIKLIIEKCPKVKQIRVIPSMVTRLGDSHRKYCEEHNVEIVTGHACPNLAWKKDELRPTKSYYAQQTFLQTLQGEQKRLFDELTAFCFDAALMTAEFYNINSTTETGKPHSTLDDLSDKYGLCHCSHASMYIQAVLFYLDPEFETGERSKQIANALKRRVEKLRAYIQGLDSQQKLATKLGIPQLPIGLPLARIEILGELLKAQDDGRMDKLEKYNPRLRQAVELRFGLDDMDAPTYRTLLEVGVLMGVSTRERPRQLEARALNLLGIEDEDSELNEG
jgi:hypothetical protein